MVAVDMNRTQDITLFDFLARRARGASDLRLIVDAVVGFIVAVAALLARGPVWHLFTSAGICFLSFGVWGIADREMAERAGMLVTRWLAAARATSAVVGFIAVVFLVLSMLGIALGRIIS
jgi:hypothetical protein